MIRRTVHRLALGGIASLCIWSAGLFANEPGLTGAEAEAEASSLWRFRVSLDKREIGYHEFQVSENGGRSTVQINAEFNVKVLFINAYSYNHQNTEVWENDCLQTIESETDDNGSLSRVRGESLTDGFTVLSNMAPQQTFDSGCLRSFAYWNPDFLQSERLLNSQTGEIVDVTIRRMGEEPLQLSGLQVPAVRYRIEMEEGPITLWYSIEGGHWLALEATAGGGRILRYEPVELPFDLAGQDRRLTAR